MINLNIQVNDFVIGTIKQKIAESYIVDIKGTQDSILGLYDFVGATKKNRPNLNVGNIV